MGQKILLIIIFFSMGFGSSTYYYKQGKKIYLESIDNLNLQRTKQSNQVEYFKNINGKKLGVRDEIIIKTNKTIDQIEKQYGVVFLKQIRPNVMVFKITTNDNIFEKANQIYNDKGVDFSHPNFIKSVVFK